MFHEENNRFSKILVNAHDVVVAPLRFGVTNAFIYIYIYGIDLDPHRFTPKWVMPKIQTEKLAGRPAISWELEVYFPRKICDFSRVKLLIGGG